MKRAGAAPLPPVPARSDAKRPVRVVLVAYPGAQVLDVSGPAAVFSGANRFAPSPRYEVVVASSRGGVIETGGSVSIDTRALVSLSPRSGDIVLVVGGDDRAVIAALGDDVLRRWVVRAARVASRWGSVCSGTFVLAECGLLDGKRVATHWDGTAALARRYPTIDVDAEALYVVDGRTWTSAGVTTGIDMALAMVEEDHGARVAADIAQRLVLYGRRPGFQSQFSPLLRAQSESDAPFVALVDWIQAHLDERLDVECLARRAKQSPRDFHRKFVRATGKTPARFVEDLRLEQARTLLAHSMNLKQIAADTGFGSAVRLSRAFERRFGIKPTVFRELHGVNATANGASRG
ncbi:MAG TPA: helix-turn-helix domain-containing protein [Polyangiaceae bacterium]|nr:helix-turn-helix domain-containing protein [Polyangiaceae bacterium]